MCNYTIVNYVTDDYNVVAKYLGDDKYNAGEDSINFTVSGKAAVDPDTAFINPDKNNPTLFAIDLPNNATGNFTVLVDGVEYKTVALVDGKADINVSGLKSGVHDIGLVYSGDDNYTGVNKSEKLIIIDDFTESKQTANITVNITDNTVERDNVLVNVTLDGNATGMVNINVDGIDYVTELVNGLCNYTILNVTRGNHSIRVFYFGNNNYTNATYNVTFSVSENASYIDPDTAFINPDKDNPTLFLLLIYQVMLQVTLLF